MADSSQERVVTVSPWWLALAVVALAVIGYWLVKPWRVAELPMPAQTPQPAVVQFVQGSVEVYRSYALETAVPLRQGMSVHPSDRVVSAPEASCELILQGGAEVVKVHPGTETTLKRVNPTTVKLDHGKLSCLVEKLDPGSSFSVETPTAVYGVRGTGWEVESSAEASTAAVFEGAIQVEAPQKPEAEFLLAAGQKATVDTTPEPVRIGQVTAQDVESWETWKGEVQYHRAGDLIVAEFDMEGATTDLGLPFGAWNPFPGDVSQGASNEFSDEHWGATGKSMRITYDVASQNPAYCGFWINLGLRDLRIYDTLVFWAKGDATTGWPQAIKVELKNAVGEEGQDGVRFISGITEEWQEFAVPFSEFQDIDTFERMTELVFTFSDLTAGDKEGALYLDYISFTRRIQEPLPATESTLP